MSNTKIPRNAEVVRSYDQLRYFAQAFAMGEIGLLIIVGPPGTAKSETVRAAIGDRAAFIEGGCTPYMFYQKLYDHTDRPIVLDDSDKLFGSRDGLFLLKIVTELRKPTRPQWNSRTSEIKSGELPDCFETSSRFAIIANSWPENDPDVAAVESRGHLLYFAPPPAAVHEYAGGWFEDEEVYDYIGTRLDRLIAPDLRTYLRAAERKAMGAKMGRPHEWRDFVDSRLRSGEEQVVDDLLRDPDYSSDNQRAKEYARITLKSERTFYRMAARLKSVSN